MRGEIRGADSGANKGGAGKEDGGGWDETGGKE